MRYHGGVFHPPMHAYGRLASHRLYGSGYRKTLRSPHSSASNGRECKDEKERNCFGERELLTHPERHPATEFYHHVLPPVLLCHRQSRYSCKERLQRRIENMSASLDRIRERKNGATAKNCQGAHPTPLNDIGGNFLIFHVLDLRRNLEE